MRSVDALTAAQHLQLLNGERMDVVFHGLSMDPLLFEGDRVIVEPIEPSEIKIGDIVTYRHHDKYPTRRVVRIDPEYLTLWCDAWPDRIFRARPDDVLGRAVARIRNGHRLEAGAPEWNARTERALRRHRRTVLLRPARSLQRRMGRLRGRRSEVLE